MGDKKEKEPPDRGKQVIADWTEEMEQELSMPTGSTNSANSCQENLVRNINDQLVRENLLASSPGAQSSKQNIGNEQKKPNNIKTKYGITDNGPFIVYIQNQGGNIGRAHRIGVSRLIQNSVPGIEKDIKQIISIGINKLKIELTSAISANKLIKSEKLEEKGYHVFVPQFMIRRLGVIRYVDLEISEVELKE